MSSLKRRLIEATVGRVLFRAVTVAGVAEVAPRFWRIELAGEALAGASFSAGDKLQVVLDDGPRTYSPFAVDPARGALSVISYAHGSGAGARWGQTARVGDRLQVFGPRGSIPLAELGANIVLVGDETGLGIARALHELRGASARYVLEVDDPSAAAQALAALQVPGAALIARAPGDAHRRELDEQVRIALRAAPDASLVLTGNASSIQHLRASLKAAPAPHARQRVKAYWAAGKRGLD